VFRGGKIHPFNALCSFFYLTAQSVSTRAQRSWVGEGAAASVSCVPRPDACPSEGLPGQPLDLGKAPLRAASPLQLESGFPAQLHCMSRSGSESHPRGSFICPLLVSSCKLQQVCGASPATSCLALSWWASVPGKQSGWFPLGRLCLCRWLRGD